MKTALTIWGNRISPVFDSANTLLIVEIKNQQVCSRRYEPFYPHSSSRLAERLADLDIEVLICGAISELPANIIEFAGVKLISFITGSVDEVLDAYVRGATFVYTFLMPGFDGRGPVGAGPLTGRGRGRCGNADGVYGRRFFRNRGPSVGIGYGPGFGRWGGGYEAPYGLSQMNTVMEIDALKAEAVSMKNALEMINREISNLEKKAAKASVAGEKDD